MPAAAFVLLSYHSVLLLSHLVNCETMDDHRTPWLWGILQLLCLPLRSAVMPAWHNVMWSLAPVFLLQTQDAPRVDERY